MKRKSIWFLLGLLVVSLTFALAACGGKKESKYSLSETEITLQVGGTKQLGILPTPEGEVAWATDNEAVATVESGLVTAVAKGEAKITATVEGEKTPLTCTVTVEEAQAGGGYTLDVTSVALKTGETKQLTVKDKNGAPVAGATFTSENPAVATVSQTGLVSAVAVGKTNVKAEIGGDTLTCAVTVEQGYTYSLNKTAIDIAVGGSDTIELITTPSAPANARPHTFTSGNTAIATVDSATGRVTGVAKGETTITCSVDGEELKATVKVTKYTVKVDGTEMGDTIEMRVGGGTKTVTVEADPSRTDITPTFTSGSDAVFTVTTGGVLEAVGAGTATLTVSVGGKDFTANVTVAAAVQYTLKAGETPIEEGGTVSINLGEDVTFTIERDPPESNLPATTCETTDHDEIVTIDGAKVTGSKVGSVQLTVKAGDEAEFHITLNVVIETELTGTDIERWTGSYNLAYLDENKTLDWDKYAADGQTGKARMANNTDLISNYDMQGHTDEAFWDYKAPIFFEDAAEGGGVNTYGRAVHGRFSIQVKLTNAVSKVIIFTGAWKASGTVKFMLGDAVLQSSALVGGDPSVARVYTLAVTTDGIDGEITLTVLFDGPDDLNGGNFSIAAVAVIGKTPHNISYTAEATGVVTRELVGAQNITEAGNLDWVAANGTRKKGVDANTVIKEITYDQSGNDGDNNFGDDEGNGAYITWTDGTAAAPANYKNFKWADNSVTIPVALTKGNFTVSLYVTGWNCGYLVAVYDKDGHFLNAYQAADEWKVDNQGKSHTAKVAVTLDVQEAGEYTFKMMKCRGSGNQGWAAIAVSQNTPYSLKQNTFDITKGGTTVHKLEVLKDGVENTDPVEYDSVDKGVVTVETDGTITVVGKGTTQVTATVGGTVLRATVTVTEYTLTSDASITLSVEKTSEIVISADPQHAVNATYASEEDATARVDESGVITAVAEGETDIKVTIDGAVLFTIHVKVVTYKLDKTELTLTLGTNAEGSVEMQDNGGAKVDGVTYSTEDNKIVEIDQSSGAITAKGFGKTIVKAEKDGTVLECTVIVKLKVETNETKAFSDGDVVNLDELDDTNVTLDWRYFGRGDFREEKKDGSLITDEPIMGDDAFYDYYARVNWLNGTTQKQSFLSRRDGIVIKGNGSKTLSFEVTVTTDVKYIAILTGAYHAKNTVSISYEGVEYAKYEIENRGDADGENKAMKVIFAPDMTNFGTEQKTFTITLTVGAEGSHDWTDNISLVAVAVVGNTARAQKAAAAATAEVTHAALIPEADDTIDLSEVGTVDWAYINNGGSKGMAKKSDGTAIGEFYTSGDQGGGGDGFGTKHQFFTWSSGTQEVNGADGDTAKTNLIKWGKLAQSITVKLEMSAKVILYISAWQPSVILDVYDANGNQIVTNTTVLDGNGGDNASKAEIALTVTEASTFTFVLHMEGGNDQANYGLAAIAVANAATD